MILEVAHKKLGVYHYARELARRCYHVTSLLPRSERYNLVDQIDRSAVSVLLNIAEGASRKSAGERRRFYEVARGSIIEIDAALDLCFSMKLIGRDDVSPVSEIMNPLFKMLSKMINTLSQQT